MTPIEIIKLAYSIKNKYGKDPFKICSMYKLDIKQTHLKPEIYKAYTFNLGEKHCIVLNDNFTIQSQKVLCAHELGHVLMHSNKIINQFEDEHNGIYEFEANLFATALLFDENDFDLPFRKMDNYLLKGLLDYNIKLKS